MKLRPAAAAATAIVGLAAVLFSQTASPVDGRVQSSTAANDYLIGTGDILDIRIQGRPQLSRDAIRVSADGSIRMPLLRSELPVACKTESEINALVTEAFRKYLVDPDVSVSVKEFNTQPVEVVGAVNRPGTFQLQRRVRLRELLTLAGGIKAGAGESIQLIRDSGSLAVCSERLKITPGGTTEPVGIEWLPVEAVIRGSANPYVHPGDYINIQEADQIYVVGNVAKPSFMPLTPKLTISRAIAQAGGLLPASSGHVRVLRRGENGFNKQITVDFRAIAHATAQDYLLQAGDIVDVPVSQGRNLLRTALSGIASMGPVYYPLLIIK